MLDQFVPSQLNLPVVRDVAAVDLQQDLKARGQVQDPLDFLSRFFHPFLTDGKVMESWESYLYIFRTEVGVNVLMSHITQLTWGYNFQ